MTSNERDSAQIARESGEHIVDYLRKRGYVFDITDEAGRPIRGDSLLILINASDETVGFRVPRAPRGQPWRFVLDTARPEQHQGTTGRRPGGTYPLQPRSVAILRHGVPG